LTTTLRRHRDDPGKRCPRSGELLSPSIIIAPRSGPRLLGGDEVIPDVRGRRLDAPSFMSRVVLNRSLIVEVTCSRAVIVMMKHRRRIPGQLGSC
jgi:hypothetical protein